MCLVGHLTLISQSICQSVSRVLLLLLLCNISVNVWYFVGLQTPYNQEIQQDAQANSQLQGGYAPAVQPPYGGQHQTLVSGSYEPHRAAAGVHQPTGSPSPEHRMHSGQQMPAHQPVYVSTVPSAMPQAQSSSASYTQPTVSCHPVCYNVTHDSMCS